MLRPKLGPRDLHGYQRDIAVPFLLANPFSALFVDLGLGKTIMVLTALAELNRTEGFNKALIIAPLRVAKQTWPAEFEAWSHLTDLTYTLIRDEELQEAVRKAGQISRKERGIWVLKPPLPRPPGDSAVDALGRQAEAARRLWNTLGGMFGAVPLAQATKEWQKARLVQAQQEIVRAAARNPAKVHIVNREQVEFLVDAWGKQWPYDVVIVDESTSFGDHKSRRFKALARALPRVKRLHALTATPVADGYMKLFSQIFLMDRGARFGRYITAFRERYFSQNAYTYKYALLPGAEAEIARKISDIVLVMKAEDYHPLDKPLVIPRPVEMTPDQLTAYKKFERSFFLDLPAGEEIEAKTAADLAGKLLQLASGSVYGEGKRVHLVHDHKIEELAQLHDEAQGDPLLVAYWYKPSLARLVKAFPKAVVMDRDAKAVDPWNKGKIPMLLVHPQSAGHGLNLQHGGHLLALFDIPWSLELYQQLVGRLARQGQKKVVRVYPLITKGTVDELVLARLREKGDAQEALFRRLRALRSGAVAGGE